MPRAGQRAWEMVSLTQLRQLSSAWCPLARVVEHCALALFRALALIQ